MKIELPKNWKEIAGIKDITYQRPPLAESHKSKDSNTVYSDFAVWSAAVKKAGCEVYANGAAGGKYTAKKDGEIYGRFDKAEKDGWLHSS